MGQQNPTGPALWSAEEPNLYILVLSLLNPDGAHVESESCQVQQHLVLFDFSHTLPHASILVSGYSRDLGRSGLCAECGSDVAAALPT